MAITHKIFFGDSLTVGVDLTELIEAQDEQIPTRINAQAVPKRHGAFVSEVPVLGPKIIRLQGKVYGSGADPTEDCRTQVRNLEKQLGTSRRRLYYFSDRFYNAYKSGFSWGWVPGSALQVATISIEFFCDDPFEYAETPPSPTTVILTAADTVVDITQGIYRKNFTLNNPGNYYIYFKSTMTADQGVPVTYSLVRNQTVGRNNQYTGTVAVGQALVTDNSLFTVKNNGVNDLKNWNGSWLSLASGDNSMQVEGQPGTYLFEYDARY